ncbi:MAG: sugB 2 [Dehalococcoidia bacterium]|nr:sugB 2 [Dehalococcoidia bacterium]
MAAVTRSGPRFSFFTTRNIILVLVAAFVILLAIIPLFFLLWNSFKDVSGGRVADFGLGNFSLTNFVQAYASPQTFLYLGNTFYFAIGTMVVALVFGGVIAFLVERTNTPLRNVIYGLMFIPLIMPGMLKAIAWVLLLSPRVGILNKLWFSLGFTDPLFNAYSMPAMWWVEGLSMSPLVFFMLGAALRAMDPSLEEAAYTAGANRVTTLFRVTFRLMLPALASVSLLMFVRGLESLEVPLIMGSGEGIMVYATQIYFALKVFTPPKYGEAYVFSIVMLALAFLGVFLYQRVMSRSERCVTVTGKGYRPRLMNLGKWRPLMAVFVLFFLFVAFILPFLVLAWVSLLPYLQLPSAAALANVSLKNYADLFNRYDFPIVMKNTAILAAAVGVGGMLLALIISWMVIRLKPKGVRFLDTAAFLPMAVPSIALAFSFMVLFLRLPIPIYGTIWILVLAHLIKYLPMATRFTHTGLSQIHRELEDAAASSGASFVAVQRRILIPLLLPSLVSGGLYILMLTVKVFSIAAVLYTPDTMVFSVYVYQLWDRGGANEVGALAVVMVVFLTALTIVARKLTQGRGMQIAG